MSSPDPCRCRYPVTPAPKGFKEITRYVLHRSGIVGPRALAAPYLIIGAFCYYSYASLKMKRVGEKIEEEKKRINQERQKMGKEPYRPFKFV